MILDVVDEIRNYRAVTKHDGFMLLYNFAVVLSGGYAVTTFEISDRWTLMGFAVLFALFWTAYFKFAMLGRFWDHPRFTGADEDERTAPVE